ncbi:MAG: hypothetical protein ACR2PT_24040 [Endozoicomonas sp.]
MSLEKVESRLCWPLGKTEGFQVVNFNGRNSLYFFCAFIGAIGTAVIAKAQGERVILAIAGGSEGQPAMPSHPELEIPYEPFRRVLPGVVIVPPGSEETDLGTIDPVEELHSWRNRSRRSEGASYGKGEYGEGGRYARNHPGRKKLKGEDDSSVLRAPARRSGQGTGGPPGGSARFRQVPDQQNGGGSGSSNPGKTESVEKESMKKENPPSGQKKQPVKSLREMALATLGLDQELPQKIVQERLVEIQQEKGLLAALQVLYVYLQWLGYLPKEWEKGLEHFEYPDPDTGITFRAMINHPRSDYSENYDKRSSTWAEGAKCWICPENIEDARHRVNRFLRVFQLMINGREYFLQPPPFPYGRLHFVLAEKIHTKMHVNLSNLQDALAFLELLPTFTVCMNSDIGNAGGSIIGHHHYQVFDDYWPPVTQAQVVSGLTLSDGGVEVGVLNYPFTVFRITSADGEQLIRGAARLIEQWKTGSPETYTANYVFRKVEGEYRIWLFLRDSSRKPTDAFMEYKTEPWGFIEVAGHLLLSRQKTDKAKHDLEFADIMLPVIKESMAAMSRLSHSQGDELLSLMSAVMKESPE